ncbi:MAG: hypothetical protein WC374_00720, partial [Phycisphaerae bacterium]
ISFKPPIAFGYYSFNPVLTILLTPHRRFLLSYARLAVAGTATYFYFLLFTLFLISPFGFPFHLAAEGT